MNNRQLIESLDCHIDRIYLSEENLIDKIKNNLKSYRDTQIKPWATAKGLINKAKEDYKIQHDYATTLHPFITGLQDAITRQGKAVLSIVIGLLLIDMRSFSTVMPFTELLELIFKNIKPGLLLFAFADLGVTPLYYKLRAKYMSESLETTNEDRPKHPYINSLKRTLKKEKKHIKRGLAGVGVGGALGAGAGYFVGKKYGIGKKAGALIGGIMGAHGGGVLADTASRDADRIKKEYAEFQKKKKKKK